MADWNQVFNVVHQCHYFVFQNAQHVHQRVAVLDVFAVWHLLREYTMHNYSKEIAILVVYSMQIGNELVLLIF